MVYINKYFFRSRRWTDLPMAAECQVTPVISRPRLGKNKRTRPFRRWQWGDSRRMLCTRTASQAIRATFLSSGQRMSSAAPLAKQRPSKRKARLKLALTVTTQSATALMSKLSTLSRCSRKSLDAKKVHPVEVVPSKWTLIKPRRSPMRSANRTLNWTDRDSMARTTLITILTTPPPQISGESEKYALMKRSNKSTFNSFKYF